VFSAAAAEKCLPTPELELLNREFSESMRFMQIQSDAGKMVLTWPEASRRLESPLWPAALSAAELLTSPLLERVRECASPTCGWLFLDLSRNSTRRWCDMLSCGNRAKARRFHERHRREI
jgi:predicted RNA-binding Zn ribbon-like protein